VSASPAGRRPEILALLRGSPSPLDVATLARQLDVHPNTVRFHLDHLVGTEQVQRLIAPPGGRGRPRLVFRAAPGMDPAGPRNYRLLAEILAAALADEPDAIDRVTATGRIWGRLMVDSTVPVPAGLAIDRLVGLLADLGFAPERPGDGASWIGLRHCPFLEVAQNRAPLVCRVHLGLMQGALAAMDAPTAVDRLEPFVEPDLCRAHLNPIGK
jgi:predicted ArsR family transcriptional regulator